MTSTGRNDPCPCGSGQKFKKCCGLSARSTSVDALIKIALQHFVAQRLHDANSVIERILSINPHHPDGLHLSGLTAGRLGDSTRAIEQIESAIAYNPDNAAYHNSLGLTYAQCKRTNYAIASFSRALSLRPGYLPALNNLAIELVNANECDQADSCYRQLLKLSPSSVRTYTNYATLLQASRPRTRRSTPRGTATSRS